MTGEERLIKVFSNVNDWLKFAEAKNAMILAFNAASIYGITKMFDLTFVVSSGFTKGYLLWMIIQLVFSCICAFLSFAPRVKILKGGLFSSGDVSNVWFFEYLKGRTQEQIYLEVTGEEKIEKATSFEKDTAEQIRQNSRIASIKYSYFTIAVWITIAAYITIPLAVIFWIYNYFKN